MLQNRQIFAYIELIISMIFLGATLVLGKILVIIFPIFLLLGMRFLIGASIFGFLYYLTEKNKLSFENKVLIKRDWLLLFLQSFFGAFLFNMLMLFGLSLTSASAASIITSTIPAFISIFSFFILKEFISKQKLIAVCLSILGLIFITVNFNQFIAASAASSGNLLVLLAIIVGALFPICVKLLNNKVTPLFISFMFNLVGLLLFFPFAIADSLHFSFYTISNSSWILVVIYGLTANVLYLIFWNRGLTVVPASTASLFTAIMPMNTAILAYIFLGEILTTAQLFGALAVIAAIILGARK